MRKRPPINLDNVERRLGLANRPNTPRLEAMDLSFFQRPLFYVAGNYVSFLGLIAFVALFSIGLFIARALQSNAVRRFFARFKIDSNFIAIVTTILSVAALVFFTVFAINAAGIPLAWNQPLP